MFILFLIVCLIVGIYALRAMIGAVMESNFKKMVMILIASLIGFIVLKYLLGFLISGGIGAGLTGR